MESFKVEVEETKTYKQRMISRLLLPFISCEVSPLFLYFLLLSHPGKFSALNGAILLFSINSFLFLIVAIANNVLCTCYITLLEIKGSQVRIIYTKKGENFEISDSTNKFEFTQGSGGGMGAGSGYLKIKYEDKLSLKQLNKWDWCNSGAFQQTTDYLKEHKLLGTSYWIF